MMQPRLFFARSSVFFVLTALSAPLAASAEQDLEALYELRTEGTSTSLKPGEPGRFVLSIRPKGDAHISDEAPLKVALGGKNLTWAKATLTRADAKPSPKQEPPAPPTFEVPFQAGTTPGQAVVEANVTFFLCTQDVCARQQRAVSVPVTLQPARP